MTGDAVDGAGQCPDINSDFGSKVSGDHGAAGYGCFNYEDEIAKCGNDPIPAWEIPPHGNFMVFEFAEDQPAGGLCHPMEEREVGPGVGGAQTAPQNGDAMPVMKGNRIGNRVDSYGCP